MPQNKFDSSDFRDLGTDPRTGQYRQAEAEAAARLVELAGALNRDPSGDFDWIDADGRTYDAVGPVPRTEYFNAGAFTAQIDRHFLKQGLDYVVVDLSNLSTDQKDSVQLHLSGLTAARLSRIIILGG